MLIVAGRPFLEHLIWNCARFGFRRFLLLAGYKANSIKEHFPGGVFHTPVGTVEVEILVEPEPLGTAGALRLFADKLDDTFLMLNGDSAFHFNWLELTRPLPPGSLGRIALRTVADASRYGIVTMDADGCVRQIDERRTNQGGGLINGGVYWLSQAIVDYIAPGHPVSLESEIFPALIVDQKLRAERYEGPFIDIGVPEDYRLADDLLRERRQAVFFDRDGVLNVDKGYVHRASEFEWRHDAIRAIKFLNDQDILVFVVTNQAGVGRGFYTEGDVRVLHGFMQTELKKNRAHIDDFRYCPHHPEAAVEAYRVDCNWRKPGKGMLADICACWPIDVAGCLMIGDKDTDILAGQAMGMKTEKLLQSTDLLPVLRNFLSAR